VHSVKLSAEEPQVGHGIALLLLSAGGADARECSLFGPRSLKANSIDAEGAKHIGEALKINKALTSLKCAPALPLHKSKSACFVVSRGALARECSLFGPRSLLGNCIGAEGVKHIGDALKMNKALTSLK
jgi:hypothetical protein